MEDWQIAVLNSEDIRVDQDASTGYRLVIRETTRDRRMTVPEVVATVRHSNRKPVIMMPGRDYGKFAPRKEVLSQLMSTPEYEEYTIWMAEARMNGVLRMDREEIIATVERHLDRHAGLKAMLDYIEDSPFREEIWESIESKDLRDAADVLEYMGA